MKKNRTMRLAALLLVLTLITSCFVGGTFAKYTTTTNSNDHARVAYWGFDNETTMDLKDLFAATYDNGAVKAQTIDGEQADVIAPGTTGTETFIFSYDENTTFDLYDENGVKQTGVTNMTATGPEVAYQFTVSVEETCDSLIENNPNILWSLDGTEYTHDDTGSSWDKMVAAIKLLSGDATGSKRYEANTLPAAFGTEETASTHTITWKWIFDENAANANGAANNDVNDTAMGNADLLDDCSIKITITATQLDN